MALALVNSSDERLNTKIYRVVLPSTLTLTTAFLGTLSNSSLRRNYPVELTKVPASES